MWEIWVESLLWEDPLEKGTATHSSFLAWRTPWTVNSMGSQGVGHDWGDFHKAVICVHIAHCYSISIKCDSELYWPDNKAPKKQSQLCSWFSSQRKKLSKGNRFLSMNSAFIKIFWLIVYLYSVRDIFWIQWKCFPFHIFQLSLLFVVLWSYPRWNNAY